MITANFFHIVASALWIGVAVSFPFWGNRMKRADNLPMVLGIGDTLFILKNVFIMGGLTITAVSGIYLTSQQSLPFFDFGEPFLWLALSQTLFVLITINSCTILAFMILARRGRRWFYRFIPTLGYNNIALILLVYIQMVSRPTMEQQWLALVIPVSLIVVANGIFMLHRSRITDKLKQMTPGEFAQHYFHLLNTENMYELLRLFHDDAVIVDPFATKPVKGLKAIEKFFQFLGDQFDTIRIEPETVDGDRNQLTIRWKASGTTKNGLPMESLLGTNTMSRQGTRISKMAIDFDVKDLPQLQLYTPGS